MSGSTIGQLFQLSSFGESHGPAIGGIVDGCPAGLSLSENDLQLELDRRKPGKNPYTSPRKESDKVEILSGIFDGVTTGTPIAFIIRNHDQKSSDYSKLEKVFRPGHGDYTYHKKYGIYDHRGGGRASARETAVRVAAGAIAKKFLYNKCKIEIKAYVSQIGNIDCEVLEPTLNNLKQVLENPFFLANLKKEKEVTKLLEELKVDGDSIGAKINLHAFNVPVGLGEPVYDKLDANLAKAFMSINAVKAVEFGSGVDSVIKRGSENRDPISQDGFMSNNAGGILAGISSGDDVIAKVSFKPTSSIKKNITTINKNMENVDLSVTGRHDPCVALRAVPIVEAMASLVIADNFLIHFGYKNY